MAISRLPDPFPRAQLPPHSDNKNVVSQIRRYNRWLAEPGHLLHQPNLSSYRDLLLETLAPASARLHLSSIRRSCKALVENPQQRAALVDRLQQEYATADFGAIKAMADELELRLNGRESGPVFTRMRQGRGDMRRQEAAAGPKTTRSVQRLLGRYPISIGGQQRAVRPHEWRRSYARILFKAGISTEAIRQNLGHVDVKATQAYIGLLDGSTRAPVSAYEPTEILARMQAAMF